MTEKTQSALGAGLLGVFILGSLIWYMSVTPAPGYLELTQPNSASPEPVFVRENTQFYEIEAMYPSVTPLVATVGAEANQAALSTMKAFVDDSIATFKANGNFESLTPEDLEMQGYNAGRSQALTIEYASFGNNRVASYVFTTYEDTMGAHPNAYVRTFVFDLQTGLQLSLGDLFTPNSNYLATLSSKSRKALLERLGEEANTEYLNSGTTPEELNFQSFLIEENQLTIIFPPYQVGPWAIGTQTVSIPFVELGDILKEEYK